MSQSKLHSLLESAANIVIGFAISIAAQMVIFPWFGIYISFSDNLLMGLFFTVVSLIRSYVLRRAFNRYHIYQYRKSMLEDCSLKQSVL